MVTAKDAATKYWVIIYTIYDMIFAFLILELKKSKIWSNFNLILFTFILGYYVQNLKIKNELDQFRNEAETWQNVEQVKLCEYFCYTQ